MKNRFSKREEENIREYQRGYQWTAFQVHSQYSSKVSPFQAKTEAVLAAAMADAAWSCVL